MFLVSALRLERTCAALSALVLCLSVLAVRPASAATPVRARATFRLCDGYQASDFTLELKYRTPFSDVYLPLEILSQSVDTGAKSAAFEFWIPQEPGVSSVQIAAFCRNSAGLSDPSPEATISNCDVLGLFDSDGDGIPDRQEDTNCNNYYDPGDFSNAYNVDTDGDGVRDLVELVSGTDPSSAASNPRPMIFAGGPFDPDGDGNSNPVVWRNSNGYWYIRDFVYPGNHLAIQWGLPGDIPFVYQPSGETSNVGVIRMINREYYWFCHGSGFARSNAAPDTALRFGQFGDNILPGPWEERGTTNPAVARLFNDAWTFDIHMRDGSVRSVNWGHNGDVPKVQDYDGDGLFDIAVYRPSEHKTFVIRSSDKVVQTYDFGSGTADMSVRGDYTGDGVDDISLWEPVSGVFTTLTSTHGFNAARGRAQDPNYFQWEQLGLYSVHVPLSWNRQAGRIVYTVVDHALGMRFYRMNNDPAGAITSVQWGLNGDAQG